MAHIQVSTNSNAFTQNIETRSELDDRIKIYVLCEEINDNLVYINSFRTYEYAESIAIDHDITNYRIIEQEV